MKNVIKAVAVLSVVVSSAAFAGPLEDAIAHEKEVQKIRDSLAYSVTTGDAYARTYGEIQDIRKKATAGIAGVAAMSNVPVVPGKDFSVGAAFGSFDSENALAAGLNFTPSDAPVAFKASIAATSQEVVYGGGMAFGF